MTKPTTYLCPAPTQERGDPHRVPCLADLPCAEHGVTTPAVGMLLHGSMFAVPHEPSRWQRLRDRLLRRRRLGKGWQNAGYTTED